MALGALGVLPAGLGEELRLAVDFCIGAVLFELGARVDLGWLRRAPWLAALATFESALAGVALYWVLGPVLGLPAAYAACGAALGVSTSPAVVLRIAQDVRAQGQVTERMLLLSAVNTAFAVASVAMLIAWLEPPSGDAARGPLGAAALRVAASLGAAAGLALLALGVFRAIGKRREAQLPAAFGTVALGAGVAAAAELSIPLVLFALGVAMRALDARRHVAPLDFGRAGQLVYVLLFALAGASLDLRAAASVGLAALAFIAVRAAAKGAAVLVFARATRQPLRQAALLALTLQPMSAVTLVLAQDAALAVPALGETVVPVVFAAVAVFELLGPLCVQAGLRLAGEAEPLPA
jgi:Kef-type K+ transport system membrane component KefB